MKRDSGTIKCIARKKLMGNYGILIGALILAELFPSVILTLFQAVCDLNTTNGMLVFVLANIIVAILSILLSIGLVYMLMNILRGVKMTYSDLFFAFKNHPDRFILAGLLELVIFLLPIAPGYALIIVSSYTLDIMQMALGLFLMAIGIVIEVILTLIFSMIFEIMIDNPEYGVIESFKESANIMKGNKGRLFYLGISFIGWLLLGLLSFGIAYLWISIYINAAMVVFYFDITGEVMDDEEQHFEICFDEAI
ncbi:MAG: DUF975 family protein [Eubacterium sp.]|nr:DUF975 family protein [Eubacterium sp.]